MTRRQALLLPLSGALVAQVHDPAPRNKTATHEEALVRWSPRPVFNGAPVLFRSRSFSGPGNWLGKKIEFRPDGDVFSALAGVNLNRAPGHYPLDLGDEKVEVVRRAYPSSAITVDLRGKHGRIRTMLMPTWVYMAVDAWTSATGLTDGHVFRPVNRADRVAGERLGEKVVWLILKQYAAQAGSPGIAPHDLRCTCPNYAVRRAANLSRSSCCWGMPPFKRPNAIWEPDRIWFTLLMTESS